MLVQETLKNWQELLEIAKPQASVKWEIRPGKSPSTVSISTHLEQIPHGQKAPVLLYRDTNAWCPFCERVWFALEEKEIPFDVELIDLRNKPKWYTDMVPTGLVPAVKISGELVYESKSILLALEEKFAALPLLPQEPAAKTIALEMIEACDTGEFIKAGFQFLRGKPFTSNAQDEPEVDLDVLRTQFETKLDEVEQALGQYTGAYFLPEFSLVDIMYTPALKRLDANLPLFRGYQLRENERFPNLRRWFNAIYQRPAYQKVQPDDRTNNLVMQKLFGLQPISQGNTTVPPTETTQTNEGRWEAAARLSDNHKIMIADILKNSGITAWTNPETLPMLEDYVDFYLKLVANYLVNENTALLSSKPVNTKEGDGTSTEAIGAITLSYLRNRVCVPRDMSAGAATALRSAIDTILASLYSFT